MTGRRGCRGPAWAAVALAVVAGLAAGCQRDTDVQPRGPAPPGGDAQRLHSTPGANAMTINLDLLRTWSEQLCTLPALDLAAALRALGIAGSLVDKSVDFAIVEPPPAGASRLGLTLENLGKNKGHLGTIDVTLQGGRITRAELDQRFGGGNALPRVDFDRPSVISYQVQIPGAPFRCTVSASFATEPGADAAATEISLRRDVVKPEPGRAPQ